LLPTAISPAVCGTGGKDCNSISCSYADAEWIERADLTDLAERKTEGREVERLRWLRRELRESLCARVGGGGNIGVVGAEAMARDVGTAQERWRWRRRVRRVVISVSRM